MRAGDRRTDDRGMQFEIPTGPVALVAAATLMTATFVLLWWRGTLTGRRLATVWAACLYVTAVLCVTVLPLQVATGQYANTAPWYTKANFIPVLTIDPTTFVLNVVMTVPLGLLIPLLARHEGLRTAAIAGLLLSGFVETVQFTSNVLVSSGRTADVNDLLANTAGAVLGYAITRTLLKPRLLHRAAEPWRLDPSPTLQPH